MVAFFVVRKTSIRLVDEPLCVVVVAVEDLVVVVAVVVCADLVVVVFWQM